MAQPCKVVLRTGQAVDLGDLDGPLFRLAQCDRFGFCHLLWCAVMWCTAV